MTDVLDPPAPSFAPARINRRLPAHPVVAIVGATGAVGVELIESLTSRDFPVAELRLLASARSAGTRLPFRGRDLVVRDLTEDSFAGVDVAFFSAGAAVSRRFAPIAVNAGAVVIDNSSAFRMVPEVPLIVPEVNAPAMVAHGGLIANPNCVAAILTVALAPLAQAARIRRLSVATYQAASGAGAAAMEELRQATGACLEGRSLPPRVLPHPCAFNIFSHNAAVDPETGYNGEEEKVIAETRRILGRPDLPVGITCIRVPVLRAHGMAVSVEFETALSVDEARCLIAAAPGLRLVDDRAANHFPMPVEASGQEEVLVGRLRQDLGDPSGRSLALFLVGDQLLKGAALNAVQIAEALLPR